MLYSSRYGHLLGFKGGTALYFFYGLPRFSVDCDFDLTEKLSQKQLQKLKSDILLYLQDSLPDLTIKTSGTSDYSIRYVAQYGGDKTIKIEISPKIYDNQYEIRQLQGLPVQVMKAERMFAHKLCAFISRYQQRDIIANRDLFDIRHLFKKFISPYQPIIIQRFTKMIGKKVTIKESIQYIIDFIQQHQKDIQKNILNGLGELVDEKDKNDIKAKLLSETLQELASYIKKR
jgi:predicted nucleotidyltransferase component of viral defense system